MLRIITGTELARPLGFGPTVTRDSPERAQTSAELQDDAPRLVEQARARQDAAGVFVEYEATRQLSERRGGEHRALQLAHVAVGRESGDCVAAPDVEVHISEAFGDGAQ